jgi:hypothetical protein
MATRLILRRLSWRRGPARWRMEGGMRERDMTDHAPPGGRGNVRSRQQEREVWGSRRAVKFQAVRVMPAGGQVSRLHDYELPPVVVGRVVTIE